MLVSFRRHGEKWSVFFVAIRNPARLPNQEAVIPHERSSNKTNNNNNNNDKK